MEYSSLLKSKPSEPKYKLVRSTSNLRSCNIDKALGIFMILVGIAFLYLENSSGALILIAGILVYLFKDLFTFLKSSTIEEVPLNAVPETVDSNKTTLRQRSPGSDLALD
eukprot:NODE_36_length_36011_cov_1.012920.p25 type:complete len:110 gc:universal NODE_36_length_36011_cov_1.012920:4071-4400(+)